MLRRTTFDTIDLKKIRHLTRQTENTDLQSSAAGACQGCGHPLTDHNVESDTCWYAMQTERGIKLCTCRSYRA